jgi:hypothetical protein
MKHRIQFLRRRREFIALLGGAAVYVTRLSQSADEYDYIAGDGHKNIGAWIDRAAQRAGR